MKSVRLLFLLFSSFALWGCSRSHPHVVVIEDDAKLLESQARVIQKAPGTKTGVNKRTLVSPVLSRVEIEKKLQDIAQTKDVDVVLRTATNPSLSALSLPAYLDQSFDKDPAWRNIPATNWFSRALRSLGFDPAAPAEGVEFIVLSSPKFVAIRFGNSARLRAISSGLMSSPELFAIQQHATVDPAAGAREMLAFFAQNYPPAGQISWRERIVRWLFFDDVDKMIDSITLNHWEIYNHYVLAPTLYLQAQLARFIPTWSAPIVSVCIILGIASLIKRILRRIGRSKGILRWAAFGAVIMIEVLALVPSVGSLLMISHQRLEDRQFVEALLSPGLVRLSPIFHGHPISFIGHTGFFWALAFALVVPISLLSESFWCIPLASLPAARQQAIFDEMSDVQRFAVEMGAASYSQEVKFSEETPFGSVQEALIVAIFLRPLKYLAIYFYLPFPVSLALCNRMAIGILTGLRANWKHYKLYKEIAGEEKLQQSSKSAGA